MSYDIYYTLRAGKKSYYTIDILFFGKKRVYDFKEIFDGYFDTYDECLRKAIELDLSDFVIRYTLETGGGLSHKDYHYKRNRIRRR